MDLIYFEMANGVHLLPGIESVKPDAYSVMQSLRSVGYRLESAIADIVDNSISARANEIKLRFYWNSSNSYISIQDNGIGMTENELRQAMRIGSKNPLNKRDKNDLGRFGMGLKTAAFSLCKRLTVKSKSKENNEYTRCWDLDCIENTNDWTLLTEHADDTSCEFLNEHVITETGTVVLLEKLDRIITSSYTNRSYSDFLKKVEVVEQHIGMVFHRFLYGSQSIKIFINGCEVLPWDPFLLTEIATQELSTEQLKYNDTTVTISPYILPHHSKVSKDIYERAGGPKGWNAQQGFYVYRNKRLLVAGTWFKLFRKEEPFRLARILLDISSDLDFDWKIDIKKADAVPPQRIIHEIEKIAKIAREASYRVYYHRGVTLSVKENATVIDYVWEQIYKHGALYYRLNRSHPLLMRLMQELSPERKRIMGAYLTIIEESAPNNLLSYALIKQEDPPNKNQGYENAVDKGEIINSIKDIIYSLKLSGYKTDEILQRLESMKPFSQYTDLIPELMNEVLKES